MKTIPELKLNFRDARNFQQRENKELFNKIFVRTSDLDKLLASNIYFLLGEKGVGKTAFATFLKNNSYKNFTGDIKELSETDYKKFVTLKKEKHLEISDYVSIWKVIIYLLLSEKICLSEKEILFNPFASKFKDLKNAIDEYYLKSFSPEIINAIQFIEKSSISAGIMWKHAKASGEETEEVSFSESKFQINLLYIQKKFENAFKSMKLERNYILFIDGIDTRPDGISYEDYIECIKGLADAVWELNTTFFANIKDSKGRMRVVIIMRPDIFSSMKLSNLNSKFSDNSVLIDWRASYSEKYRESKIFEVLDRLLFAQQEHSTEYTIGKTWDYYFPPNKTKVFIRNQNTHIDSFKHILNYSLFRPRDIIVMLQCLQSNYIHNKNNNISFDSSDLENKEVKKIYSEYMWSEVKEYLSFYFTNKGIQYFLNFFSLINKFQFSFSEFCNAHKRFRSNNKKIELPNDFETVDNLLQLLYDINIICYVESSGKHHWCYRERNYVNIRPKVEYDQNYQLHPALSASLKII